MKKLRKSSWIAIAFFIYVTATGACLLPRNTVTSDTETSSLAGGYVIVLALWLVLRKKEKLQEQRRRESYG